MFAYEKKTIQRRVINGTITRSNIALGAPGAKLLYPGISSPQTTKLSTFKCRMVGGGPKQPLLNATAGTFLSDPITRAHLIKAAWDGGNAKERMTQWRTGVEEVTWAGIEGQVETNAASMVEAPTPAGYTIPVQTQTDDPGRGDVLLGADMNAFKALHPTVDQVENYASAKQELNRQITMATINLNGVAVNTINCPDCVSQIQLNPII